MEKDQKPQSNSDKQSDKKSTPQGGNLVWYMLALGVLLLLMVTVFNNGTSVPLGFSDLLKLVEAGLFLKSKRGRTMVLRTSPDFERRLKQGPDIRA